MKKNRSLAIAASAGVLLAAALGCQSRSTVFDPNVKPFAAITLRFLS